MLDVANFKTGKNWHCEIYLRKVVQFKNKINFAFLYNVLQVVTYLLSYIPLHSFKPIAFLQNASSV